MKPQMNPQRKNLSQLCREDCRPGRTACHSPEAACLLHAAAATEATAGGNPEASAATAVAIEPALLLLLPEAADWHQRGPRVSCGSLLHSEFRKTHRIQNGILFLCLRVCVYWGSTACFRGPEATCLLHATAAEFCRSESSMDD